MYILPKIGIILWMDDAFIASIYCFLWKKKYNYKWFFYTNQVILLA